MDLYNTKYYDANFEHYSELLDKYEGIKVSPSAVRSILMEENILSPMAHRSTKKKNEKKLLEEQKKNTTSKKEINRIESKILEIEDVHPRRPRCAYFGEMIQMDASLHNWFGGDKSQLHIAIDDATGTIVGAYLTNRRH